MIRIVKEINCSPSNTQFSMPKTGGSMHLISKTELSELVKQNKVIQKGDISCVEGIKYDLRISNKLLSEEYPNSIDISKLEYYKREKLNVAPGELVFLLTEEILNFPKDIYASIIWKRKMNHEGVLVLGGSAVDPLYCGRLLFGLYNFSSEPFPIKPERKITSLILYRLEENEIDDFDKPEARIDGFPDDLLRNMSKYKPTSQQQVELQLKELRDEFTLLKKSFDTNEQWFKEFKDNLEKQRQNTEARNAQIDRISELLEKEIGERKVSEKEITEKISSKYELLRDRIEKYTGTINSLKVAVYILLGLAGAAIVKYLFKL